MTLTGVIMPAASDESPASGALQPVANRPLVCHVLDQLQLARVDSVALVFPAWGLDELRAAVEQEGPPGLEVAFVSYGGEGGVERALDAVADLVGEGACLVHAADGLLTQPLAELVQALEDDGSPDLLAFVHRSAESSTALATRRVLRIAGHPMNGQALELAGVCLFGPGALSRVREGRWWRDGRLDLASISERLVDAGARMAVRPIDGWLQHRGSTSMLLELNRFLLDLRSQQAAGRHGAVEDAAQLDDSNRIEGCVVIHPTARIEASTIVGPAIIGAGAAVLNAYIGPYTSIGEGVHIEGAEIERSIILPAARITHIGGRLVGSVVGRDARVFRDFSLPRALRLNVGDGGEVALC